MSMDIEWFPDLDAYGQSIEDEFHNGLRRAGPKVGKLLVKNMRSKKKWKNRTGKATASLNYQLAPLAGPIIVADLYGTAYYLEWIEGGSKYLGFPSRYESMVPVVQASAGEAAQIVIAEWVG